MYRCDGVCEKVFHYACLGVSNTLVRELKNPETQIRWLCTDCNLHRSKVGDLGAALASFRDEMLLEVDRRVSEAAELKASLMVALEHRLVTALEHHRGIVIDAIRDQLGANPPQGMPVAANTGVCRSVHHPAALQMGAMSFADVTKDRVPPEHPQETNTISLNPPLAVGTAPKTLLKTVPVQQARCWIFFSRLATETTDEQVADMVNQCLGVTDVIVRRLLARDRDVSSVTYISFKVGLPLALKEKALDPSTWPHGVSFREFLDKPRVTRPLTRLSSLAAELAGSPHILATLSTPSPSRNSLASTQRTDMSFGTPSQLRKRPRPGNGSASEDD